MLTNAEGLRALENHERRAKTNSGHITIIPYGLSTLQIVHTTSDEFSYRWGINAVERHTALRIVQTYEQEPRR